MSGTASWWGKGEPDLRSLYEWIDLQQTQAGGARAGVLWGILGGSSGVFGGMIGVLAGGLRLPPAIAVTVPILLFAITAVFAISWYYRGRSEQEKAAARWSAEMRGFFWKLMTARWQGNVKGLIGEEAALQLNAAAYQYLRCRNSLRSPAWQAVGSDSSWAKVRNTTAMAMDIAMARLVTMVGQGARHDDPTVQQLIEDMTRTADESAQTASRLGDQRGIPTDASNELRKALGELRALNEADEEFQKLV